MKDFNNRGKQCRADYQRCYDEVMGSSAGFACVFTFIGAYEAHCFDKLVRRYFKRRDINVVSSRRHNVVTVTKI